MSISGIANPSAQSTQLSQIKSVEKFEGSKPDGDGDRDDLAITNAVAPSKVALSATGNLGLNLNVIA